MNRALPWRAIVGVVGIASFVHACINMNGNPDFPQGGGDGDLYESHGLYLWSVTDAVTGRELSSGCGFGVAQPVVSAVPGQRLVVERWTDYASVESTTGLRDLDSSEFWCGDHPRIERLATPAVYALECFVAPEEGAYRTTARVLKMDIIPSENVSQTDSRPHYVLGKGYRVEIEVLSAGEVLLRSSGKCDTTDAQGTNHPRTIKLLNIACGPKNPCCYGKDEDPCQETGCVKTGECARAPCSLAAECSGEPGAAVCAAPQCEEEAAP